MLHGSFSLLKIGGLKRHLTFDAHLTHAFFICCVLNWRVLFWILKCAAVEMVREFRQLQALEEPQESENLNTDSDEFDELLPASRTDWESCEVWECSKF